MKTTIFVVDDFPDVGIQLCNKLRTAFPSATVKNFKNPWRALHDLQAQRVSEDGDAPNPCGMEGQRIAVADLYISSYWDQRDEWVRLFPNVKAPWKARFLQFLRRLRFVIGGNGAAGMLDWRDVIGMIEHSLEHFWRPMVRDYGVKLIVYSHVREYLKTKWEPSWNESCQNIIGRLMTAAEDNVSVSESNFIDKHYSSEDPPNTDTQQQQLQDDLDRIVATIRQLLLPER